MDKKILKFNLVFLLIMTFGIFIYCTDFVSANSLSKYMLINFATKSSTVNTNFNEDVTNRSGYLNGTYGADAIYLGSNSDGSRIKFKMAGVIGWVNSSDVELVSMDSINDYNNYSTSYYTVKDGIIIHKIANSIRKARYSGVSIGKNNVGLKEGVNYLSYDGHYFYEDSLDGYKRMADDYNNNTSLHAINSGNPYYNYYQFLSHRSISNYTADDIANYIALLGYNKKVTSWENLSSNRNESQIYGEQNAFVNNQNTFGANSIMMLGVAINESAYGRSYISVTKNNLFGHNAYDLTPGASASGYVDVSQSIWAHARYFVSEGYMDPKDYANRYNGGHFGDKSSGFNIKYASDPYWGEKNAQYYFNFDKTFGYQDYGSCKIGIKTGYESYSIRTSPDTSSNVIYSTGVSSNYPVIILDEVEGTSVNGNNLWYKIQADPVLNSDRTSFVQDYGYYSYNDNYAYIHSSAIDIIVKDGKSYINKSYTITFDADGGRFANGDSVKKVTVSSGEIANFELPVRDGYEFVGWNEEIKGAVANKTYKAVWRDVRSYKITFDCSGGRFDDGSSSRTIVASYNQAINVADPVRDGYEFVKWSSDIVNATEDKTYTAVWKKVITYDITFDANGGKFSNSKDTIVQRVKENEMPSVLNPVRDGYVFVSWDSDFVKVTCNKTYKAVWRKADNEDKLIEKNGNFYFSYLDVKDKKLMLQGYQTIIGIENNLTTKINYRIDFVNIDTSEVLSQHADRITNLKDIPKLVYSPDGKDYTYSWFNAQINTEELPSGNYKMYIVAYTDKYYSKTLVNNKIYKTQATSFKSGDKYTVIRNNYSTSTSFVELKIRDELLADKSSSYIYNQYDKYVKIEFIDDKLHLKGTSYSYGMDLSSKRSVTRKIIFENTKTFKKYVYDVGSISNGDYNVYLPVSDNLDKIRAWYDATIDITNIPKGEYVIYVTTTSNITDISELTEKLGRSLSDVTSNINNKNYSFNINRSYGNRIELIVK